MSQLAQRLIMAAGGAKKDSTYVDDVFSTYLYRGNNTLQTVNNGIKLTNNNQGSSVFMRSDGTGSTYIPATEDFKFGTGAFTVEFFIYFVYSTDYIAVFDGRTNNSNNNNDRTVTGLLANGQFNWWNLGTGAYVIPESAATQVPVRQWSHVAYVREGTGTNEAKIYINGSLVGTGTDGNDYNVNQPCRIGGHNWAPGVLYGSLSNYRVVKGTAVYTSNFTPPTSELTNISGTVLLCFQSSTDPYAATVTPGGTFTNGTGNTPIAQSFGPFTADDGEGGMVWVKSRQNPSTGHYYHLVDTERAKIGGFRPALYSNTAEVQNTYTAATYGGIASLNNNGFTISQGTDADKFLNVNGVEYGSWTFRKQKGFFDVVTWTGNNTAGRQLPHNLGSRPGMVAIKCTSHNHNWSVWHRGLSSNAKTLTLNDSAAEFTNDAFNGAAPTDSVIYLSSTNASNAAGKTYVAYLWAGGASDEPGAARSVDFDGSGDYLTQTCDAVLRNWWDQAFTVEYWVNADGFVSSGNGGPGVLGVCAPTSNGETWSFGPKSNGTVEFYYWNGSIQQVTTTKALNLGQWYHLAMVYDGSSSIKIYINGTLEKSATVQGTPTGSSTVFSIGKIANGSEFNGKVSNVRIAHQALYTSSFRPPTAGLTDITNTKLLCCNKNTVTGSTITPSTITSNGNPHSSTSTPFDDPNGFKFGEGGDQNIVKTGSFTGAGSAAVDVNIGWEPSWVLIKNASATEDWFLFDNMRGVTSGNDNRLQPNNSGAEFTTFDYIEFNSTGFKVNANATDGVNGSGNTMTFVAIRRPDGLVGKPAEAGTDVFAMAYGSTTNPSINGGIPIDFAFVRQPATTEDWYTGSRLTGANKVFLNKHDAMTSQSNFVWDYMDGWQDSSNSNYLSWMWKRNTGFDVVYYTGDGTARQIQHSMGNTPEMIWLRSTTTTGRDWCVYHKGLNGGVNPWLYKMRLDHTDGERSNSSFFGAAPTPTYFSVGTSTDTNGSGQNIIAFLFASVDGISKCGYYDGSDSAQTITTGFQPRYVIIKNVTADGDGWITFDTTRGWTSGNDEFLYLNSTAAQVNTWDWGDPTSTGFTLTSTNSTYNSAGAKFIYYAHA